MNHVTRALALLLSTAAAAEPQFTQRTLLIGDSITARLGVDRAWDYNAVVIGSGGQTMATAPDAIPAITLFLQGSNPVRAFAKLPKVIILLGLNDWRKGVPLAEFQAAYALAVSETEPLATVWCVLPIPQQNDDWRVDPYRDAIKAVCTNWIDPREAFPEWSAELYVDRYHLNAAGSEAYAQWLIGRTQ